MEATIYLYVTLVHTPVSIVAIVTPLLHHSLAGFPSTVVENNNHCTFKHFQDVQQQYLVLLARIWSAKV